MSAQETPLSAEIMRLTERVHVLARRRAKRCPNCGVFMVWTQADGYWCDQCPIHHEDGSMPETSIESVSPWRCCRLLSPDLRVCGGPLRVWYGTDGHNGRERFATCERCGATS